MSEAPEELRYAKSHEWIRVEGDGTATIGITDHAQAALNDIVYVELPDVGDSFAAGEEFGVVESVKSASDVYLPVGGEVVAANEALDDEPETVNSDPYGDGWLVKIKLDDDAQEALAGLLDAAGYLASVD
ncbi:MAG: glycine cleavage system protein GcvH [Thermoplasmatota archaeon]